MIESRCGLLCNSCEYVARCGCKGCFPSEGHPFHGDCSVALCSIEKGYNYCGECKDFPCELLKDFSYDKEHGDEGKRIEQCRVWSIRKD